MQWKLSVPAELVLLSDKHCREIASPAVPEDEECCSAAIAYLFQCNASCQNAVLHVKETCAVISWCEKKKPDLPQFH